jgi:hypothetical protein
MRGDSPSLLQFSVGVVPVYSYYSRAQPIELRVALLSGYLLGGVLPQIGNGGKMKLSKILSDDSIFPQSDFNTDLVAFLGHTEPPDAVQ